MNAKNRKHIKRGLETGTSPGSTISGAGEFTSGIVKDILTKSAYHPHGIKVRLDTGEVGRVQEIVEACQEATARSCPDTLPELRQRATSTRALLPRMPYGDNSPCRGACQRLSKKDSQILPPGASPRSLVGKRMIRWSGKAWSRSTNPSAGP